MNGAGGVWRRSNRPIAAWRACLILRGKVNHLMEKNLSSLPGLAFAVRAIPPFSWTQPCWKLRLLDTNANALRIASLWNQNRIILQALSQLFDDKKSTCIFTICQEINSLLRSYELLRHWSIRICWRQSRSRVGNARPQCEGAPA